MAVCEGSEIRTCYAQKVKFHTKGCVEICNSGKSVLHFDYRLEFIGVGTASIDGHVLDNFFLSINEARTH